MKILVTAASVIVALLLLGLAMAIRTRDESPLLAQTRASPSMRLRASQSSTLVKIVGCCAAAVVVVSSYLAAIGAAAFILAPAALRG
jgi:hypothetical protein